MSDPVLHAIDVETWPRRHLFEHYQGTGGCSYSMTVELDATRLAAEVERTGRRTYAAHLWAVTSAVNEQEALRTDLLPDGSPAEWDRLDPAFTIFHPATETFSSIWVPFDPHYPTFEEGVARTAAEHTGATSLFPQGLVPPSTVDISSVPWVAFTGFDLHLADGARRLRPIVTLGRYVHRDDRVLLPMAVRLNHAVADGYHAARFVTDVQALLDDPGWLAGQR